MTVKQFKPGCRQPPIRLQVLLQKTYRLVARRGRLLSDWKMLRLGILTEDRHLYLTSHVRPCWPVNEGPLESHPAAFYFVGKVRLPIGRALTDASTWLLSRLGTSPSIRYDESKLPSGEWCMRLRSKT